MMKIGRNYLMGLALGTTALAAAGMLASEPAAAADAGTPHYAAIDRIAALEEEIRKIKESYVRRGQKNVDLTVSGQVNRGVLFFDDGEDTDKAFVDNGHSSTRVRFDAKARINDYWRAGARIEVQIESNSTGDIHQTDLRGVGAGGFSERHMFVWVERMISDNASVRVSTGQTDTATNGISEADISGTDVIAYSGVSDTAGGLGFRTAGGGFGPTVGTVFDQLDGLSRDDVFKVEVNVGPLQLAGSAAARNRHDIAARFDHTFNDVIRVAAAAGYWNRPANGEDAPAQDGFSGSASVRHIPTGISLTGAAGVRDFDAAGRNDQHFIYGKLAIEHPIFEIGATAFAIDYFYGEDSAINGDESQAFGLAVVQNIDAAAMELYAGGRVYDYDHPTIGYDEIYALLTGARLKF